MQSWNTVLKLSELRIFVCILSALSDRHVIFPFLSLFVILTPCSICDVIMGSFQTVVPIYQVPCLVYQWCKINVLKWMKQCSVNSHNRKKLGGTSNFYFFFNSCWKDIFLSFVSFPHYTVKQQVLQFSQMDAESGRMPCLSAITWKNSEEFLASFRKKRIATGQSKNEEPDFIQKNFWKDFIKMK